MWHHTEDEINKVKEAAADAAPENTEEEINKVEEAASDAAP